MTADIASVLHWSLADLLGLDCEELLAWHAQAKRLYRPPL